METGKKTCCVFGHRKIEDEKHLKIKLSEVIDNLIVKENVDTFLLGSRSDFNYLCLEVISEKRKISVH